jgi:hypothetical protein
LIGSGENKSPRRGEKVKIEKEQKEQKRRKNANQRICPR